MLPVVRGSLGFTCLIRRANSDAQVCYISFLAILTGDWIRSFPASTRLIAGVRIVVRRAVANRNTHCSEVLKEHFIGCDTKQFGPHSTE